MDFNKVVLIGRLTRDPEVRDVGSTKVAKFGLAVGKKFTKADGTKVDETMFIDCSAWGKLADVVEKYCKKGSLLCVDGELKLETWEDKQGGGKRSKHSVNVHAVQLGPKNGGGGQQSPNDDEPSGDADAETGNDDGFIAF